MSTQHKDIVDADLHEPKGAYSAAAGKVYTSDGAASGSWLYPHAHGSISYVELTTGTTLVTPTAYAKIAPTTVASGSPIEFTEATTARLTYTGTPSRHITILGNITISQTIGATRTQTVAIYKNGVIIASSEAASSVTGADKDNMHFQADITCATNDYFEVYIKTSGTGNVVIYTFNLYAQAA